MPVFTSPDAGPDSASAPATVSVLTDASQIVARWGRSPISPFLTEPGNTVLRLAGGGVAGYRPVRSWAVIPTNPATPPGSELEALDSLLQQVGHSGRRPVFVAVSDPEPYRRAGLHLTRIAEDARIDLGNFSLAGKRMANVRHSVASARRSGLRVVPFSADLTEGLARISTEWLGTKRGGEMGFTLGRFDPDRVAEVDCRVCLDADDRPVGFVTWRPFADGTGRVLDLMRRAGDAPNPTMDLLIADGLLEFAISGVETASLSAVPLSRGRLAERVYPTVTLRRYKEKFGPTWEPMWLVAPSAFSTLSALAAAARAFCSDGLIRAARANA
jgi:phosphatidylglycerol lysyltransferase